MKFFIGVTDNNWYNFLANRSPEDVNVWQPGGNTAFRALASGAQFLFKLKYPLNMIAGLGFFSSHTFLPISIAWDVFGTGNGCSSLAQLKNMILPLRKNHSDLNPQIGCIVLTNPIFFEREDWINVPDDWSKNIVQGKSYSTDTQQGTLIWNQVELLLKKYLLNVAEEAKSQLLLEESLSPHYGSSILTKVRLGQGAFRVLVTDAYSRKCAISGEKTLPVLDAAHIKPYAESGGHFISNALLLRSDLHKLFDTGYLTITSTLKIEISNRIKQEFENGKEYYKYHGTDLLNLPTRMQDRPKVKFINWHNENIYRG